MLLNIHPLLTGDLLKALDDMGHSDLVLLADANFPAHRIGPPVVEVPGIDVVTMTAAVRTVLPLDDATPPALMDSGLTPRPAVQDELLAAAGTTQSRLVDRWEYYELARRAAVIISTGEQRVWANVLLAKGLCLPGA
ncbi:RbsD/FucU family protein [Cellulomonas xiejunii]|uniref:Transport protein RbsD/FucU n=1 Tax=Cellulomonas xiejunii TaxID=2968083 RepID=A0ABY5KSA5_9CELL|nr:RbsD/FucU domain-containing protein [Cellulomonas xiejunii]MCC2315931.1 transport protein RbsD/FucU [Cellulomonas xiejunii]MCC2320948.1 transport protein RbsD/FucU [Cellulomonas xiejunii]UUI71228.1 transport protein RbsD/FucU [Cellulomonas xiejunii]